jgi:hypothetical protein
MRRHEASRFRASISVLEASTCSWRFPGGPGVSQHFSFFEQHSASPGFPRLSYDRSLWALRTWLNSWSGVGHVALGVSGHPIIPTRGHRNLPTPPDRGGRSDERDIVVRCGARGRRHCPEVTPLGEARMVREDCWREVHRLFHVERRSKSLPGQLRIATDQRAWILAGALAAAGGRLLRRRRR